MSGYETITGDAIITEKTIEERGYETIGMRIINSFDRCIISLLRNADFQSTTASSAHFVEEDSVVSSAPVATDETITANLPIAGSSNGG
jgi:hypothetical protein